MGGKEARVPGDGAQEVASPYTPGRKPRPGSLLPEARNKNLHIRKTIGISHLPFHPQDLLGASWNLSTQMGPQPASLSWTAGAGENLT